MKNTKLITASRTTSFRTDKGDIEVVDKLPFTLSHEGNKEEIRSQEIFYRLTLEEQP